MWKRKILGIYIFICKRCEKIVKLNMEIKLKMWFNYFKLNIKSIFYKYNINWLILNLKWLIKNKLKDSIVYRKDF